MHRQLQTHVRIAFLKLLNSQIFALAGIDSTPHFFMTPYWLCVRFSVSGYMLKYYWYELCIGNTQSKINVTITTLIINNNNILL